MSGKHRPRDAHQQWTLRRPGTGFPWERGIYIFAALMTLAGMILLYTKFTVPPATSITDDVSQWNQQLADEVRRAIDAVKGS